MAHCNNPSIYKVPQWIKQLTRCEAYSPQLVSFGPFHHGEPNLQAMDGRKEQAMMRMVHRSGKGIHEFFDAIKLVVEQLKSAYDDLDVIWREDPNDHFVMMMVKDGCFLLEMGRAALLALGRDVYPPNAPNEQGDPRLLRMIRNIRTDMFIVDNQLPMLAIWTLEAVHRSSPPGNIEINNMVLALLGRLGVEEIKVLPLHPLDLLHMTFCGPPADRNNRERPKKLHSWMPPASELHYAGISFSKSNNRRVSNITFRDGMLSMPLLRVHGDTEICFLNMLAYERLHPDAGDDLMSYVFFTSNITKSAADVALLRFKGVIKQTLGSDEAVAQLFSTLSKGTVMSPLSKIHNAQCDATAYHNRRWNQWRASFVNTHVGDPLVLGSFIAAIVLLLSSLLQTIYAVMSYHTSR